MPRHETITVTADPPAASPRAWTARLRALQVELFLLAGLLLWVAAFWPQRAIALGVPAAVILWFGLPTRPPFVASTRKDDAV